MICCGLCKVKRAKVAQKDGESSSSGDENKKHEYAVKYQDLEVLLADFNRA